MLKTARHFVTWNVNLKIQYKNTVHAHMHKIQNIYWAFTICQALCCPPYTYCFIKSPTNLYSCFKDGETETGKYVVETRVRTQIWFDTQAWALDTSPYSSRINHSHGYLQNHRQIALGQGAVHIMSLVSQKGPSTLLAGVPLSPKEAKGESRVLCFRGKTSRKLFSPSLP